MIVSVASPGSQQLDIIDCADFADVAFVLRLFRTLREGTYRPEFISSALMASAM
jgi:hypothetical protein